MVRVLIDIIVSARLQCMAYIAGLPIAICNVEVVSSLLIFYKGVTVRVCKIRDEKIAP